MVGDSYEAGGWVFGCHRLTKGGVICHLSAKSKLTLIWHNAQATFVDAMNVFALFLTNSCMLSGTRPVSVSTSSDIRS
jgi:hypothetical protein